MPKRSTWRHWAQMLHAFLYHLHVQKAEGFLQGFCVLVGDFLCDFMNGVLSPMSLNVLFHYFHMGKSVDHRLFEFPVALKAQGLT